MVGLYSVGIVDVFLDYCYSELGWVGLKWSGLNCNELGLGLFANVV